MKLDHIVLLASDLEQSLHFYNTLLGLLGFDKDQDHVYGNEDGIFFDIKQASDPEHAYRRYAPGLNHIGFTAANVDVVLDIKNKMSKAGFDTPDIQHIDTATALFLKDPDGMRIEITAYGA
jgi:lactoylglutathione lyase